MAKNNQAMIQRVQGQAPATERKLTVADQVQTYLSRPDVRAQIVAALPKHVTAERLARVALTTIRTNPLLLQCTLPSLLAGAMQAFQLGLELGIMGHAYLVPFKRNVAPKGQPPQFVYEATFIIGYKGLLDLARRSGNVVSIGADAIYSNDKFVYRRGYVEVLEHEPNYSDRGQLIGFYAYATTKDGGRFPTVMTVEDVDKIRARSKAKDNGPWVTDYEEMGKKTVLRRLCKTLPMSIEIARTILDDEKLEFDDATSVSLNLGSLPGEQTPPSLPAADMSGPEPTLQTSNEPQEPDWDAIEAQTRLREKQAIKAAASDTDDLPSFDKQASFPAESSRTPVKEGKQLSID